jgi:hypothetical protein
MLLEAVVHCDEGVVHVKVPLPVVLKTCPVDPTEVNPVPPLAIGKVPVTELAKLGIIDPPPDDTVPSAIKY